MSFFNKTGEGVRKSPVANRKSDYAQMEVEDTDPYAKGITFHCRYIGKVDLNIDASTAAFHQPAIIESLYRTSKTPHKKCFVLVKEKTVRVQTTGADGRVDNIPLNTISQCGSHESLARTFFITHRVSQSNQIRVQVMQATSNENAREMVKTVSDLFDIAFSAMKARLRQLQLSSLEYNMDSPRAKRANKVCEENRQSDDVASLGSASDITYTSSDDEDDGDEFTALAKSRSATSLQKHDVKLVEASS